MTILEVKNIKKSFSSQKLVVDSIDLTVDEGEIVCLLGPSGCGKTTLLRLIAGLEHPDSGEVWFAGQNMADVPPYQRDFGMMFQDFALFPHKNVYDNVAFGLRMHGMDSVAINNRVRQMLDLVDLAGLAERTIEQLSGGEQQRVALARSLAPGPKLLMLDEPLGSLDRALRERLMLEVRTILKRVGVTAIYVTHDQAESFAIADRLAVMNEGKIEQLDSPEVVYQKPATPFIARFLGFFNLLEGNYNSQGIIDTPIGSFRSPEFGSQEVEPVMLLIKPDGARIGEREEDSRTNRISGVIKTISFRGRYYQVWLEVQGETLMFELPESPGQEGNGLDLLIDPQAVLLLPS